MVREAKFPRRLVHKFFFVGCLLVSPTGREILHEFLSQKKLSLDIDRK